MIWHTPTPPRQLASMNRKAFWSAAAVAAVCAAAMLTLLTWPPFRDGSWELAHSPAWWQFEWLAAIGFVLSALPGVAVAFLHTFFASAEYLRYPFAELLLAFEVLLLCLLTYRMVAYWSNLRAKVRMGPSNSS